MKGRLKESQQVWLPFRRPFHHQSPQLDHPSPFKKLLTMSRGMLARKTPILRI